MLLDDRNDAEAVGQLQHMFIGGEVLTAALASRLLGTGLKNLTNIYGPTETTVWAFAHYVSITDVDPMPIGRPLAGIKTQLMPGSNGARSDALPGSNGARPDTAPGLEVQLAELIIGGPSVAQGYRGRLEQTAAAFIRVDLSGER